MSNKIILNKCTSCDRSFAMKYKMKSDTGSTGGIIVKCNYCSAHNAYDVGEPSEVSINGGSVVDSWHDPSLKAGVLEKYDILSKAYADLIMLGGLDSKSTASFDLGKSSLFICGSCQKSVEQSAYNELSSLFRDYIGFLYNHFNFFFLKTKEEIPDQVCLSVPFICTCSRKMTGFFMLEYPIREELFPSESLELCLVHVSGAAIVGLESGAFSKSDCIDILEKYILRWRWVFDEIIISSPFFGHQWKKKEEITEIWDNLFDHLPPNGSTIVTRPKALNDFKKSVKENGFSLDFLESFNILNPAIRDAITKQDFHAKIYAGMTPNKVEVINGSFNMLRGPSIENFGMERRAFNSFQNSHLTPMGICRPNFLAKKKSFLIIQKGSDNKLFSDIMSADDFVEICTE